MRKMRLLCDASNRCHAMGHALLCSLSPAFKLQASSRLQKSDSIDITGPLLLQSGVPNATRLRAEFGLAGAVKIAGFPCA